VTTVKVEDNVVKCVCVCGVGWGGGVGGWPMIFEIPRNKIHFSDCNALTQEIRRDCKVVCRGPAPFYRSSALYFLNVYKITEIKQTLRHKGHFAAFFFPFMFLFLRLYDLLFVIGLIEKAA